MRFSSGSNNEEKALAASTLTSVGKLKAEQIRSYFASDEDFALSIARLLGQGGLADWLDGAPSEMPRPLQESLLIVLRNRAGSGLLVLDSTANLRFGAGQFTQLTEEGRRFALRAMAEPRPVSSDIYRGDPSAPEQALLDTFVPIQSPGRGRTVGVLVLRNDLAYLYDLIQTWPVKSPTAESFLMRLDGDHVLSLNELRFRKQTALRMRVPLSASRDSPGWPSTAAARGQVGIWEARDYLDHAVLAYTLPVPGPVPGWGMVVKMDLTEVFGPVQRLKNTTVGVTVSFILLALLALGSWLWLLRRNAEREIAERERIGQINDQLEQRVRERTAELEQANLVLVESETRFRMLVEGVTDYAILMLDPDGRVASWNAGAERLEGYRADEIIGQHFSCFYPEEDVALGKPARALETAASEGRFEDESWRVRKDGSRFWANVILTALRDENGQLRGFSKITRDLTERRQMEETLRASEARYQGLYENAPDMFVSVDAATARIIQCNQTLAAATGYSKEEIVGQPILEMYHPDCLEEARQAFQAFVETGEVRDRDLQLKRKDGSRIDVSLNVRAVRDAEGRILQSMSIWRDITERKRHEELQRRSEEMEEQNRQIQQASRLKSEFLANMSHELRTPLNAILGFAQLMHDGKVGAVSDPHREYLGDIVTSGRHLLQLVNDILDLAKVESGKMEFLPEPVELPKLVGEVRDILRTLAAEKRVIVETQVDPALTEVVTDPRRLKQILYNYLSNALKFTPEGGLATVRVGPEGPEALRLEVEDTGAGIRPEDLGRLFVEFQQLETGAAKRHPGTGLGLALTRRIVEAQGGHVGVRSTPGTGSVFFAVLPRRPREAALEPKQIVAHPRTAEPLVLVVEDDAKDRAWLEATLSGAGYAVESAKTGGEALARCRETAFDAIVLDILLPDMSGWDALRAIRIAGLNRDTPTIVVTVVAEKGAGAGFFIHDYLTKPVRAEDLLASLTSADVPPSLLRPILVVEDQPADRRLMEELLKQLGYRPLVRPDGASGLQAAVEDPPAAVVLDLVMSGMDGFEFLERFRRTGIGRRTPVIVWTAHDLTAAVLSRLKDSAQAVVEKSRGAEALIEELRAHVLPPSAAGDAGRQRK